MQTVDTDGTPTDGVDQTLYISDAGDYGSDNSITMNYDSPTYALSMTVGSPTTSEMQTTYASFLSSCVFIILINGSITRTKKNMVHV